LDKAPGAFRTISEVADEIDVPQHVLRFWESRFAQIRPMKRGGGRRYYRPDDVDLLRGVRHLLYGEGYTIRGVQRILREQGAGFVQEVWRVGAEQPPPQSDEDRTGDDTGEREAVERSEPSLPPFGYASPRMREPAPVAPGSLAPIARRGLGAEEKNKLRAALDELVECHRLIQAALSADGAVELLDQSA